MLDLLFLREIIAVAGTIVASYTDIKKGLIYDFITLPMIAAAVVLNVFESNFEGFLFGGIVFAIGYIFYYTGKIGGGDVKLYTAITMLLPRMGGSILILNAFIFSGLAALVFIPTYYTLKYLKKTGGIKNAIEENQKGVQKSIVFAVIIAAYLYIVLSQGFVSTAYAFVIGVPMLFGTVFIAFEKGIREKIFLEKISIKDIEEDELIAREFLDEEIAKKLKLGAKGLIDKDIQKKFEELGIKQVPVYRNLPKFAPFILLGLLGAIFWPDFFSFLV